LSNACSATALARLEDRYLGHARRLNQADIIKFLGKSKPRCPSSAIIPGRQVLTGLDWRLVAAVAYQESQWDPNATSYTNVRGIMMLTEKPPTACRSATAWMPTKASWPAPLHQPAQGAAPRGNRGTRPYLARPRRLQHRPRPFQRRAHLARQLKADPNAWYEMKRVLPLLAQPKYAQQLKIGKARGGEAVILVENIRSYYDILQRNTLLAPTPAAAEGLKSWSSKSKSGARPTPGRWRQPRRLRGSPGRRMTNRCVCQPSRRARETGSTKKPAGQAGLAERAISAAG
jgi:membrane-bound lytic murein transglycosylase F